MKIIFVSNFINHHQLSLCNYLFTNSDEFIFVSVEDIPENMVNFGYDDLSKVSYVVKYNHKTNDYIDKFNIDADIAIYGASSDAFMHKRMEANKLSFVFSERLWKKGTYRRFIPQIKSKVYNRFTRYKEKKLYVLCASAYLPYDLSLIDFPVEKCFKWGYFTSVNKEMNISEVIDGKDDVFTICWVGRFIPLKRGVDLIKAVKILKRKDYKLRVKYIGTGPLAKKYQRIINKYKLNDYIEIKGNMPQEKVRFEMIKSHALVFSSDFNEGWGAVVNEAMDSCCVPIISHAVGSSPFLIKHKFNGLIYKMGNIKDLVDKISYLIDNKNITEDYMRNSAETTKLIYNGDVAGERLIEFSKKVLNNEEPYMYASGPMSNVKILKNDWIKNYE